MNISAHISYSEATKSQTATRKDINNSPSVDELASMRQVSENCFEPLREYHGKALGVSSFFRSQRLNRAIGGSRTSQHCKGEAVDIDADIYNNGITNLEIFEWLLDNVDFDQLICEYPDKEGEPRWVHISYKPIGNRNQVLIAERIKGRTQYRKL